MTDSTPVTTHPTVSVNGRPVTVYGCRVSAIPFNQVWPGYQRPIEQTEAAAFASWDMSGPVTVEIDAERPVGAARVRPASAGISTTVEGGRIRFELREPRHTVVEIDGPHHALHLFASPPESDVPAPDAPGVRWFGPGEHRPGRIDLESGQTAYLAPGAVVYGSIHARGASDIRICGRGILDVSQSERGQGGGAVRLTDCSDAVVEGIVMRDPDVWCLSLFGCRRVEVADVKLVGLWRYNADGIDVCNSQEVRVRDCFVRAYDDNIALKGLRSQREPGDDLPLRAIRVERCALWNDWGRALEIGAETCAPEISDVVFEDCDILRATHIAMDIQHGDRAAVRDVRFRRIRVEIDADHPRPRLQTSPEDRYDGAPGDGYLPRLMVVEIVSTPYSKDTVRGTVRDVEFCDIEVTAPRMPVSVLRGFDAQHGVEGVTIGGLRWNGQALTDAAAARLTVGAHVQGVRFDSVSR